MMSDTDIYFNIFSISVHSFQLGIYFQLKLKAHFNILKADIKTFGLTLLCVIFYVELCIHFYIRARWTTEVFMIVAI